MVMFLYLYRVPVPTRPRNNAPVKTITPEPGATARRSRITIITDMPSDVVVMIVREIEELHDVVDMGETVEAIYCENNLSTCHRQTAEPGTQNPPLGARKSHRARQPLVPSRGLG